MLENCVRPCTITGMETTQTTESRTYYAIRMSTGKMTHLRGEGSSQTACGRWIGHTRQYKTDETEITCARCADSLSFNEEAVAQGFNAKGVK